MKHQLLLLLTFAFLTFSCSDPCDDIACGQGYCDEGICICDDGYEGDNCSVEIRERYIKTWNHISWICDGSDEDLSFNFEKGTGINEIILKDVDSPTINIIAIVTGNTFVINTQEQVDGGDLFTVSGNGSISGDILSLTINVTDSDDDSYTCAGTFN